MDWGKFPFRTRSLVPLYLDQEPLSLTLQPGPEKVIWFLTARKSIILCYSQQQEKIRKFLQKHRHGSSIPLDIIFTSANHVKNTSSLTPVHLAYSRNLPILLYFCVFWGPSSQRRCYAATLSRALGVGVCGPELYPPQKFELPYYHA